MSVRPTGDEPGIASGENCVVIFAPFGQDAALMAQMLANAAIEVQCVSEMEAFTRSLANCAAGLLTTEALCPETIPLLRSVLQAQPAWSDLPLIVLTAAIDSASYALLACTLGNVTIIQRPLEAASLLTVVQTALRARQKQYEVRDLISAEEKQQARIQELNENLLLAIDTARMGTWHLELQTGAMTSSQRCRANFGLSPEASFPYDRLVAMIVPEDRGKVQAAVEQAIATHSLYEIEYRIRWPDGSLHWILASGRALYNASDTPIGILGVTLNVTERKRSEENLRESKQSLDLAINGAQLGTFYCEMPLDQIIWNDIGKSHLFLPPEAEADFDLFYSRLHPDDRTPTRQALERSIDEQVQYNVEYRVVAPEGRIRWINAIGRGYYTETGSPYRFDGITIDITEKKTRERTLSFLVEINDATRDLREPEAIMAMAARMLGEFMRVSRCAYAPVEEDDNHFTIYGDYTSGCRSIVGRYPLTAFGMKALADLSGGRTYVSHDIEKEILPDEDLAAYRSAQIQAVICTVSIKDDKLVGWMAVHQTEPRQWTPQEVEMVEIVSERSWAIIERARADRQLKARAEEISGLNARLQHSMQEIHHRVKNNLQVISAMIEMQAQEYKSEKAIPLEEYMQLKVHIHTLAIVHDLLTKSVKEDENVQRVSVKRVLDRLLPLLQQTAWRHEVDYVIEEAFLTPKQCVALSIILNELVTNAFKHGKTLARVRFHTQEREAFLEVSDDGNGFPEDFTPHLAANMGLEIVENLLHTDLNGSSRYENRPEGGARVTVAFPLPSPE